MKENHVTRIEDYTERKKERNKEVKNNKKGRKSKIK